MLLLIRYLLIMCTIFSLKESNSSRMQSTAFVDDWSTLYKQQHGHPKTGQHFRHVSASPTLERMVHACVFGNIIVLSDLALDHCMLRRPIYGALTFLRLQAINRNLPNQTWTQQSAFVPQKENTALFPKQNFK